MEKITSELYYEITRCSGISIEPWQRYNIEEVIEMLEEIGYEVKIHEGPSKVTYRQWIDQDEYKDTFGEEQSCKRIVAVLPGVVLPERVDDCKDFDVIAVWHRETKACFRMLLTILGKNKA